MKNRYALVAQLDRATGFYPVGYAFESHREYKCTDARVVIGWTANPYFGGSIPSLYSTRDVVQSGRTLALGVRGRRFKSCHLDR